ncbi:MAG: hypothetical protein R3D60_05475 [Paracoccaceae bacterium]
MTALERYTRLEGLALWRPSPGEQRRDVIVSLGDASLMIHDSRSEAILGHWSLPAVRRVNKGRSPAVYSPDGAEDGEMIETEDAVLIEALETIQSALTPKPPMRWLRYALLGTAAVAVVASVAILPDILVRQTATMVPPAMRGQIAREVLDGMALSPTNERICAEPNARQAMATLRNRVLGPEWRVVVVDGFEGFTATALPGRMIVLSAALVESIPSAEGLAGWMLAQSLVHDQHDPLLDVLDYAGTGATLALLTTGALPSGTLDHYAALHFQGAPREPDPTGIADALAARGIVAVDYASSLPENANAIIEILNRAAVPDRPTRLLSDGEWLTIQGICGA